MSYLKEAKSISDEMIENRHHLHRNPEVGYDLPNTTKYVKEELKSEGLIELEDER